MNKYLKSYKYLLTDNFKVWPDTWRWYFWLNPSKVFITSQFSQFYENLVDEYLKKLYSPSPVVSENKLNLEKLNNPGKAVPLSELKENEQ